MEVFQAVETSLQEKCVDFNQLDTNYPHHGNQMVEIFHLAKQAAFEKKKASLADTMDHAGLMMQEKQGDDLAATYGRGLCMIAEQLKKHDISLDELVIFTRVQLDPEGEFSEEISAARSGEVIKALMVGLSNWNRISEGRELINKSVGITDLFDFGVAYHQARLAYEDRTEIFAQTAVSVSPLRQNSVYSVSGKKAFEALLRAIRDAGTGRG